MRKSILTSREESIMIWYINEERKLDGFRDILYKIRKSKTWVMDLMRDLVLLNDFVKKLESENLIDSETLTRFDVTQYKNTYETSEEN